MAKSYKKLRSLPESQAFYVFVDDCYVWAVQTPSFDFAGFDNRSHCVVTTGESGFLEDPQAPPSES